MPAAPRRDWRHAPTVLIVTDEETEAARLAGALEAEGWATFRVGSRESAVNVLDTSPVDALVTRLRTARIAGLGLLALARARNPEAAAILIVDPGEEEAATRALGAGVVDFQTRPLNLEKARAALARLFEQQRLVAELAEMRRRLDRTFGFAGIVAESGVMLRVLSRLREAAPLASGVLVTGEPGTGKDLVAAALHQNSPRRDERFVRVDCSALGGRNPARVLFGARGAQPGRLELASQGTLYLDEVGALPLEAQGRLAESQRAGQLRGDLERPPVEIDVRVIGSSSRDLEGEVEQGRFHAGLYDHLAAARIDLPPLRHRRRDIPRLARHFLTEALRSRGGELTLARPLLDCLQRYDWPGNVGELRAVIEDLAESAPVGSVVGEADLPEEIRSRAASSAGAPPRGEPLREAEKRLIVDAMRAAAGNRERAARILGIGVRTLYRKIKIYHVVSGTEIRDARGGRRGETQGRR
jgi:two-component system, NtrC family, response regulator HydG